MNAKNLQKQQVCFWCYLRNSKDFVLGADGLGA
jgi:hypothetical protein